MSDDEWEEENTSSTDLGEIQEKLASPRNRPCLTVLTGTAAGQLFKVSEGELVIGRSVRSEVRLDDDGISRNHARVRAQPGKAWVEDLDSRNGTYVNGKRITSSTELRDGDKIQVGRGTVLRFGFQDELDESFHENLVASALRDGLTKLFNKRYLMDRLDSELKFADRHETSVSLLMLDLDHFKGINDTYGHLAGDALLEHLAAVLLRTVRNEDVVARFGGEEIAIVLRSIDLDQATRMAERVRRLVEQSSIQFDGQQLRATVSIGIAGFPSTPASTPEMLIEAADQALYRAKHGGRNRTSR